MMSTSPNIPSDAAPGVTPDAVPDTAPDTVPDDVSASWRPHALVAAWLVPGLGHVLVGQRRRGVVIGLTVLGLWLSGLLIGGISIIDHEQTGDGLAPRLSFWFVGQAMLSPSVAVDMVHQRLKATSLQRFGRPPHPEQQPRPLFTPAMGRAHEVGTLYTALAGLLNLLAMLDVARRPNWEDESAEAAYAPTAETAGGPVTAEVREGS